MARKKQQPVKRKYTKKVISEPVKRVDEDIELLSIICKAFEGLSEHMKKPTLDFINSKYNKIL